MNDTPNPYDLVAVRKAAPSEKRKPKKLKNPYDLSGRKR